MKIAPTHAALKVASIIATTILACCVPKFTNESPTVSPVQKISNPPTDEVPLHVRVYMVRGVVVRRVGMFGSVFHGG